MNYTKLQKAIKDLNKKEKEIVKESMYKSVMKELNIEVHD